MLSRPVYHNLALLAFAKLQPHHASCGMCYFNVTAQAIYHKGHQEKRQGHKETSLAPRARGVSSRPTPPAPLPKREGGACAPAPVCEFPSPLRGGARGEVGPACTGACGRVGPAAHSLTRVDPPGPSPNRTGLFPGIRLSWTRGLLSFRRPRGERRSMPAGPGPATSFTHSSLVPFALRWAFPTAIDYYGTSAPTGPLHPQRGQSDDRAGGFPRS